MLIAPLITAGQVSAGREKEVTVSDRIIQNEKYRMIYIGDSLAPVFHGKKGADGLIAEIFDFAFVFLMKFFDDKVHFFIAGDILIQLDAVTGRKFFYRKRTGADGHGCAEGIDPACDNGFSFS